MKNLTAKSIILAAILTLATASILAVLPGPAPAQAAACTTGSMMPTIIGVQPPVISNTVSTTITISGTNFEDGAIVILDGYGALATTCVSDTLLTAVVPAGVPGKVNGRDYAIRVTNPTDSATNTVTLANAIKITKPAPPPTEAPAGEAARPIVTVQSYSVGKPEIGPGQNLNLEIVLQNTGQTEATNLVISFVAGDLTPLATGGVQAVGTIAAGQTGRIAQPLLSASSLSGRIATLEVRASYTDSQGTGYTETFYLTFAIARPVYVPPATPTPTPTPAPPQRPQLTISGYDLSVDPLQPGAAFDVTVSVRNVGSLPAQNVTMIFGGGSVSDSGTPGSGGISGGSGEFTNFAPLGASNVQFLGSLEVGDAVSATQPMVVNLTTQPGAYPFKITFVYNTPGGARLVDDQVITLLVYVKPQVEVSFYQDPGAVFVGQTAALPLQISNTGRSGAILGNMTVTADFGQVFNNTILVGYIDRGGFFLFDSQLVPDQPGPVTVTVTINYIDDFNQAQQIVQTLTLEAMDAGPIDPGFPDNGGVEPPPVVTETFWQKLWRFIRGLLGLDSAPPTPGFDGEIPVEEGVPDGGYPVPAPIIVPPKG
jgi:hypothetical protein